MSIKWYAYALGSQDFSPNVPYGAAGSPFMDSNSRCMKAPDRTSRCHLRCRSSQYHIPADIAQVAPYIPAAPRHGMRRARMSATGADVSITSGCLSYSTAIRAQNSTPTKENTVQHGAQQRIVHTPSDLSGSFAPLIALILVAEAAGAICSSCMRRAHCLCRKVTPVAFLLQGYVLKYTYEYLSRDPTT